MGMICNMIPNYVKTLPFSKVVKNYFGKKPIGLGTGSDKITSERLLNHTNLYNYFDVIITSDDVKEHKPNPETFLQCSFYMGINPKKCLVFEDSYFGIQAAQRAGMGILDVRNYI